MSRLSELLRRLERQDPAMAAELSGEVKALMERRAFGLNFERHVPESVELPNRTVRRGDKVRIRAPRGEPTQGIDDRLWLVTGITRSGEERIATLVERGATGEPETTEHRTDDLVVVAEFRDPIFPGLRSTGKVERGGDKPYHAVINAENYHALQALMFAYEGKVDCIYIDPPYNTRDKDWKYNNDYVDSDDAYRHSKWLAMMERRLKLAKRLLDPRDSVLIVTIDDNEAQRLSLMLEQTFPGCQRQMVSVTISPRGRSRVGRFSQVDEYIFVTYLGSARVTVPAGAGSETEVRWRYLRRNDIQSARGTIKGGPRQFYPIYVSTDTQKIVKIGEALSLDQSLESVNNVEGAVPVFPIREDGIHMNWGLTGESLRAALDRGFVRVTPASGNHQPFTFAYLTAPNIRKIAAGQLIVTGEREDGSKIVVIPDKLHDRQPYGEIRDTTRAPTARLCSEHFFRIGSFRFLSRYMQWKMPYVFLSATSRRRWFWIFLLALELRRTPLCDSTNRMTEGDVLYA